jgi:anti-anti-sigma factor
MAELNDLPSAATVKGTVDDAGWLHVNLEGELDMANVPGVEAQIVAFMPAAPARVVFDMSAVTFMDSSGIAMLLRTAERVAFVEVRNPSSSVRLVLRATGLSDVLHVNP